MNPATPITNTRSPGMASAVTPMAPAIATTTEIARRILFPAVRASMGCWDAMDQRSSEESSP